MSAVKLKLSIINIITRFFYTIHLPVPFSYGVFKLLIIFCFLRVGQVLLYQTQQYH